MPTPRHGISLPGPRLPNIPSQRRSHPSSGVHAVHLSQHTCPCGSSRQTRATELQQPSCYPRSERHLTRPRASPHSPGPSQPCSWECRQGLPTWRTPHGSAGTALEGPLHTRPSLPGGTPRLVRPHTQQCPSDGHSSEGIEHVCVINGVWAGSEADALQARCVWSPLYPDSTVEMRTPGHGQVRLIRWSSEHHIRDSFPFTPLPSFKPTLGYYTQKMLHNCLKNT